jgi:hypothetical protein
MFVLRGIAVSLTFFVLLYCLLSAIVAAAWRALKWLHTTERNLADLLFAVRILPLVASIAVTFAVVVPSFQLLEPRSSPLSVDEGMGTMPLAFGICALFLIAVGCFRVVAAQTTASRVVAHWLEGANPIGSDAQALIFRPHAEAPPLILVGFRKPKVLVSESTIALLSQEELQIALKHELAHMQSRDNLKKLIFRFCPFPGMSRLESAWGQIAELAADDAAVSKLDDAVDLAAALVKLSRLIPAHVPPICTVGFVTGSIKVRVARLLAWDGAAKAQPLRFPARFAIPTLCLAVACMAATYVPTLVLTHEITEWLVR